MGKFKILKILFLSTLTDLSKNSEKGCFKLFGYRPDDALRIAKEKRRRRSQPAIEEFSDLDSENFEIFYPDIIN